MMQRNGYRRRLGRESGCLPSPVPRLFRCSGGFTPGLLARSILFAALGFAPTPEAWAQEEDAPNAELSSMRVSLHGVVYDALTGTRVAGAAVYVEDEGYGVLSDSAGVFRFADVFPGPQVIAAVQFGYEETAARVEVPDEGAFIEIELTPQPILLEGVTAVVDNIATMERRMRSRRRSAPFQTRAFDQERLLRSASANALEFLRWETRYAPVPCPAGTGMFGTGNSTRSLGWHGISRLAGALSTNCIIRRGRTISPRVYVDEVPAIGGLDELESYPTAQIYALEVFSQGSEIRAYTYNFMQRMAERPMALIPINLWP